MNKTLTPSQFLEQRLTDIPTDVADQIRQQHEKLKDKEKMVLIIEQLMQIASVNKWQIMRNEGSFAAFAAGLFNNVFL